MGANDRPTYNVRPDRLARLVSAIFAKAAVPEADADELADALVEADARGMHSHGVQRVSQYLPKLLAGGIRPATHGNVLVDDGAVLLLDGEDGIGQIVSNRAMQGAIDKAAKFGAALAIVRNSNHHGESGRYASMAARAGMIGIVTSNGSPSTPAWGATAPRVTGPWPLAIAAPGGREPMVLDMSLGVVSKGKIQHHANTQQKVPPGWGYDRNGASTDDPRKILDGGWSALIGDYKGWGLLVMIEVLTGVLSGGRIANEITDLFGGPAESPQGLSHMFLAINVAPFQSVHGFVARMEQMERLLKASSLAPGFSEVLLPGERESRSARAAVEAGVELPWATVAALVTAGRQLGCPAAMIADAFPNID